MKNSIKHIVIAGSSGGHILPAIKYLNELSHHCSREQIIFITNEVGADYLHLIENEKKYKYSSYFNLRNKNFCFDR